MLLLSIEVLPNKQNPHRALANNHDMTNRFFYPAGENCASLRFSLFAALSCLLFSGFRRWLFFFFRSRLAACNLAGLSLCILGLPALQSYAADYVATEQVEARLVAGVDAVSPGAEVYLGVHQKIIAHWHTYWLNPGDSGSPTTIAWHLPEGAAASDILWPIPGRSSMGPITNYSYENDVTLLTRIKVPDNVVVGGEFPIKAVVDWLVCEEECIPQQVELDLVLPVVEPGEDLGQGSELVEAALARLPVESPWPVKVFRVSDETLELWLEFPNADPATIRDLWFYPNEWGRLKQSSPQTYEVFPDGIKLQLPAGELIPAVGESLDGVLVLTEQGSSGDMQRGFELVVPVQAAALPGASLSFALALLLALAGGVILNLMPCVFPVLSLKALSLVRHAEHSATHIRNHGLVYTLGVVASFAVLAFILIALKAGGAQIGWGFQFQSPLFVLIAAYLMFAVGLSLSGVFYIGGSLAGAGSGLTQRSGYAGSFFTGVLATVVATPCTAPFMAAALGYALVQPAPKLLAVFLSLGLGLALPFLLLSYWPGLQRWLPRPGIWMERLKQVLAFPMYGAAAWLVWVLVQQAGADAAAIALAGLVLIGFAAWLYSVTRQISTRASLFGSLGAAAAVVIALAGGSALRAGSADVPQIAENWRPYEEAELQQLLANGEPVFLNFTASWCISCLVNEKVALKNESVIREFEEAGVHYLKGDWTNRDPQITTFLSRFGRSGVPLYLYYPPNKDKPVLLPQILTPDIVIGALRANSTAISSSTDFTSGRN